MVQTNQTNAFETTLRLDMGSTDLVAAVQSTDGSPASPCYLVIEPTNAARREYILFDGTFTADQFATSTTANRYLMPGSAATSGIIHPAGSVVRFSPLAQHFTDIHSEATANANAAAAAQADIDAHDVVNTHVGALGSAKTASAGPETYPDGVSFHLGSTGNGWPVDGAVQTTRYGASHSMQVQSGQTEGNVRWRSGTDAGGWGVWQGTSAGYGTYTGDGTDSRTITVGFRPRSVQIISNDESKVYHLLDSLVGTPSSSTTLRVLVSPTGTSRPNTYMASTGFTVNSGDNAANRNTYLYAWYAQP